MYREWSAVLHPSQARSRVTDAATSRFQVCRAVGWFAKTRTSITAPEPLGYYWAARILPRATQHLAQHGVVRFDERENHATRFFRTKIARHFARRSSPTLENTVFCAIVSDKGTRILGFGSAQLRGNDP